MGFHGSVKILVFLLISIMISAFARTRGEPVKTKLIALLFSFTLPVYAASESQNHPLAQQWGVLFFAGKQAADTDVLDILTFKYKNDAPSLYSAELFHDLALTNIIRRFFDPITTSVAWATNFSYINDPSGAVYEFDPYLMFRWMHFPWDKYITDTFAVGWGVSYDSRIMTWEQTGATKPKKLLNYLMAEVTFALPKYPQWQLVLRVHHRSGAFGLYNADNKSSNFAGVGIRYLF